MKLSEQAAYLKGLMEGLGIDNSTKEDRVLLAVSDLFSDLTAAMAELENDLHAAYARIAELEEELADLEDDLYEGDADEPDEEDAEGDGGQYELTCPKCGTRNLVDEETLMSEEVFCAHCGTPFNIEFEESAEDDAGPDKE